MHQECNRKFIKVVLCFFLVATLTSCKPYEAKDQITLGDWIHEVINQSGIETYKQTAPYYFNVSTDSEYYEDVQKAVEYGILETTISFEPDEILTKEWTAYTLVNLADLPISNNDGHIKDSGKSNFPKHIATADAYGIMKINEKQRFYPDNQIEKNEAMGLLKDVIAWIDQKEFELIDPTVKLKEKVIEVEEPLTCDLDKNNITISKNEKISSGDIVHFEYENEDYIFEAEGINHEEDVTKIEVKEIDMSEYIEDMEVQGSFDVDFSKTEIVDELDGIVVQSLIKEGEHFPSFMSTFFPVTRTKKVKGYDISYWINQNSVRVEVKKELKNGFKMFANCKLYSLKPNYDWKFKKGKLDHAYFRMDFKTSEAFGVRNGTYEHLYADLNEIKNLDVMKDLNQIFKKKSEMDAITIPIATIRIPIPNAPLCYITSQIQVRLYASGRIEFNLNHDHKVGMDVRNQTLRRISDHSHQSNAFIRSDVSAITALKFGLEGLKMKISDISVESGAKANIKNTLHVIDNEKYYQYDSVDIPLDQLTSCFSNLSNVYVCGDISANWILNLRLNSEDCLLGKMGFGKTFNLLDERSGQIFPDGKRHIENWQFVDECTRKPSISNKIKNKNFGDMITINRFSLHLNPKETKQVEISQFPEGYTFKDFKYKLPDQNVAKVDDYGNITALAPGTVIMEIYSKDNLYHIYCTVHVRKNKQT